MPGSQLVSRETTIIVRPGGIINRNSHDIASIFIVEGSISGFHSGNVIVSDDQETIIFKPHSVFEPGEFVSVQFVSTQRAQSGLEIKPISFNFSVSLNKTEILREQILHYEHEWNGILQTQKVDKQPVYSDSRNSDYSLPSDFPSITVTVSDNPTSGYIFLDSFDFGDYPYTSYAMILDNAGSPIFFRKMPDNKVSFDFKRQPNGLLTYFAGGYASNVMPPLDLTGFALDSTYTVVDSFEVGNGYLSDSHDLQFLSNGNILLLAKDYQIVNMGQIVDGGDSAATVIGLIIQELDQSKNVVFQWRSWDHFEITDAIHLDLTYAHIDYVHGNSIEPDFDGNLLLSSRHMDEITKIDRQTGEIIWRLGGINNQFSFTNDSMTFCYQHDIRRLENGNITLFDNGNFHHPQFSRVVEYELDEENMNATLVWEYRNTPDIFAPYMGNAQRLQNGNTVIGWGGHNDEAPDVTEVRPNGSKAFELYLPTLADGLGIFSYRAFRFPWSGTAAAPYIWPDTSSFTIDSLHFVKFGDPNVVKYYLYQGESPAPTVRVDSTSSNSVGITGLYDGITYYFRVTSIDSQGNESPFSNELMYTQNPFTSISLNSIAAFQGDTILVNVNIDFPADSIISFTEFIFSGYQNGLSFVGIDTASTLIGEAGGVYSVNEFVSDWYYNVYSLLFTWSTGLEDISESGVLCRLRFVATGNICNFIPITIESALINTGDFPVAINDGGVQINPIPAYGDIDENDFIQTYDASLILKYLVDIDILECQGLANADVSLNGTISSYDASLVLQFLGGLIDTLPYQYIVPVFVNGNITMEDQQVTPGQSIEMLLHLNNAENIISFEGMITFNSEHLTYNDILWPHILNDLTIEVNAIDGEILFAGAGSENIVEEGVFGTVLFTVNNDFNEDTTIVSIQTLRWNEEETVMENIASATLSNLLNTENNKPIPKIFALHQNYPNPFNPITTLRYDLPENSYVNVTIYDILGREVKTLVNQHQDAGFKSIIWDATNDYGKPVSAGIYLYQIQAGEFVQTNKMVLLK